MLKFYISPNTENKYSFEEIKEMGILPETEIWVVCENWVKISKLPDFKELITTNQEQIDLYSILNEDGKTYTDLLSLEQIIKRKINFETKLWKTGTFHEWKRAALFPEFEEYFKTIPPPIENNFSNRSRDLRDFQQTDNITDSEDIEYSKYVEKMLVPGEKVVCRAKIHWMFLLSSLKFWQKFDKYGSYEYIITTKRILNKAGFLNKKSSNMNLAQIEDIEVDEGLIGQFLGYGTVIVIGTGGKKTLFEYIEKPNEFRDKIFELQKR